MTKDKSVAQASFLQDLFQFGVYKRNQGRVARQVTFAALAGTLLLAAWNLWAALQNQSGFLWKRLPGMEYWQFLIPAVLLLAGLWICYRLVNYPQFADFLIAVEAEMNKVSWPSRSELIRSSLVVIFLMFFLAWVLFGFDILWRAVFKALGVVS